jgi:transposase
MRRQIFVFFSRENAAKEAEKDLVWQRSMTPMRKFYTIKGSAVHVTHEKELVMSEVDRICKRSHLRSLLELHPDWSEQQVADAVGCSKSTVSRWKQRFAQADRRDPMVLFSRSRSPHHHPPRISEEVKARIEEIRQSPPDNLKRTPGPKAILYSLQKDQALRGLRLPRSTRTVWQILDQAGLIERDKLFARSPLPLLEPLQEVQMDFKDASTVSADPADPDGKRQHVVEVFNFVDAGTSRLLSAQVHEDFHAETALQAVVTFLRQYGLPETLTGSPRRTPRGKCCST